jgi:REP element-mobilizing transposase RayT
MKIPWVNMNESGISIGFQASIPSTPASIMQILKGKSSEYLRKEFPELGKRYWGMHIWDRGYFVSTGGIDREVIRNYVKEQQEDQLREGQLRLWKDNSE